MATTTIRQIAHALGFKADTLANSQFNLTPPAVSHGDAVLDSLLQKIAGTTTTGATAYFVYLGKTNKKILANKVIFNVTTGGASTQVGEVGLFSTTSAPNGAAQTLTKLMATGTLDDLTGTGILGNTTAFATDVAAGVHLWAGYRVDMASTEPTVVGVTGDNSRGRILSLGSAGVMTSTSTYAGALITHAFTWQAPALALTIG